MKKSPKITINKKLKQLPDSPGVYLIKDSEGNILYIGKARNLKKRVSSYFHNRHLDNKTRAMTNLANDIDIYVTNSEIEALLLEDSLIKKHRPRFNIRLKDDKKYPYIAITYSEDYPRVIFTRQLGKKENRYFGPFTDAKASRNTVQLINRIFRLKSCTRKLPLKNTERPCLNYQIRRCSGICQGTISKDEYRKMVKSAEKFLEGNSTPVIKDLTEQMNTLAQDMKYERAQEIRDIIFDIQQISEKQHISTGQNHDTDFIAVDTYRNEGIVLLFEFRRGILTGKKIRIYENSLFTEKQAIIQTFIVQHYTGTNIPHALVTQHILNDEKLIASHLSEKSGHKVMVRTTQSPEERQTISLLCRNLDAIIAEKMALEEISDKNPYLLNLKNLIELPAVPVHIVCFDISNLQGTEAVASMASFKYGKPDKKNYRKFKIRTYDQADDPGMIHEAVGRYCANIVNEKWEMPDLIVIDGGPTQLKRAIEARDAFGIECAIISIAKRHEELYTERRSEPYRLSHSSQELKIIQQIRDATHDFGVAYHRTLRKKRTLVSQLDSIDGIGPKKRNRLLIHFGSIEAVMAASPEELSDVSGISHNDAKRITEYFSNISIQEVTDH